MASRSILVRRNFLLGFVAVSSIPFLVGAAIQNSSGLATDPNCTAPNIVLVVLDTVRRDATGEAENAHGWSELTPNLDALAGEGTSFSNTWATAPWTVPSHASLFTGLLPEEHGTVSGSPRLGNAGWTLAEVLSGAGYETAAFYSNPWLSDRATGLLRGFSIRQESNIGGLETLESTSGDQGGFETIRNVDRFLTERESDDPFFLFVNLFEAHLPYDPPPAVRAERSLPESGEVSVQWGYEYQAGLHPSASVDWEAIAGLYGGDVNAADALLGRLLDLLEERGVGKETVVVVTSDHGENLGEHGLFEHQFSVHETLLAVPLVIRAPAELLAPGLRDEPVSTVDLYPTLLRFAGVSAEPRRFARPISREAGEGLGERPVFSSTAAPSRPFLGLLVALNPRLDPRPLMTARKTVRVGDLRLHSTSTGELELFDVAQDPGQASNLADQRTADVERLARLLAESAYASHLDRDTGYEIDAETRERLRSIGYIQ